MSESKDYYHPQLKCFVQAICYDFETRHGAVFACEQNSCCVDMPAAIQLFESIDPAVTTIRIMAGMYQNTRYVKGPEGWKAFSPPQRVGG